MKILRAILLMMFVLPGATAQDSTPRKGGTVVAAIASDPGGLNPAITTQGTVHRVTGSIFSGLVAHDFTLNPVPDLAQRWEISPNGLTYTFHLARNARFHDGKPVSSADVRFTFEELLMKYHSRTRTSVGGKLERILNPDSHTVVFQFRQPYAAFLQLVDVTNAPIMPKHLFENTDPLSNPANTRPVGSGPFRFQSWSMGDNVTLVRNDDYFEPGKPYLDRVVFKVMPSATSAAIAFENGEVDYLADPSPLDTRRLEKLSNVVVTTRGREAFATVETMVANITRGPLSDLRVRKAIAHAIDRDYIVDHIFLGQHLPATGPISRLLAWAYNPGVTRYPRDIARANRLLDEAGYPRDGTGSRFHLRLFYASQWAKVAEALREQFRDVGIALDPQLMEFSAMVDTVYIRKDFDLSFSSFENGPDPDIGVKRTVVSTNIGPIPFSNGAGYRNPEIDRLFELGSSELHRSKRAQYYFRAQAILLEELPYFWLYESRPAAAYKAALKGVHTWSAKSTTTFARDAWWSRAEATTSEAGYSRSLTYAVVLAGVASAAFVATLRRRRGGQMHSRR